MSDSFYAKLFAKAQELRPPTDGDDHDPNRILVAFFVEDVVRPILDDLETGDFGWFNGNTTTKVSTVRKKAEKSLVRQHIPEGDWSMRHRGVEIQDFSKTLADFHTGTGLVLFTACKAVAGREPFQPVAANASPTVSQAPAPQTPAPARSSSFGNPVTARGNTPSQFIDPFARYSTSPAVRTKPDPPVVTSPLPPAPVAAPPHASPYAYNPRLPSANSSPYAYSVRPDPGYGTALYNVPAYPVQPAVGAATVAGSWPAQNANGHTLSSPTPATGSAYRGSSQQAFNMAAPSLPPSREASVKAEVAAIVKDELDENNEPETSPVQLQTLFQDVDVKTMEKGVDRGLELLYKISKTLEGVESPDIKAWREQITKIRKQAEFQKCVIGVVGNTGAGKSSVINALLDEERLVPTSCMRACTAVVTEISYNTETDHPYRAKIEFITEADWLKELKALYSDLFDEYGEMKNVNRDADAQVAWSKIKAVYPKKTKETLTSTTPEQLVSDNSVKAVLGKTRVLENTDSFRFYKDLQRYVDSAEKTNKDDKKPRELEFWPLIRVVKIFVKSETLKTGAVVVDLPGVHDANAARAAVADSYMQKCTGLWIVAPITRAVDDKSAHKLLGEGFRRQLLMDGGFSSISFICSKSDDISVSEAVLSLHLEEELEPQTTRIEALDAEWNAKKRELQGLVDTRSAMQDEADVLDDLLSAWEECKDKAEEGETVYEPKLPKKDKDEDKSKKRKRGASPARKGKKARRDKDEDDDFIDDDEEPEKEASDNENDDGKDKEEPEEKGEPVTLETIENKIDELKDLRKAARKKKSEIIKSITELKAEISEIRDSKKKLENEVACRCIQERNAYSKGAIQQDFAAGLRELDMEVAEEQQGENFDPNVEIRDYDEVANNLPVFCVSSRGYQKLQGRLKKDGDPPVFQNIEQTGMPDLISFCTKITEKGRLANGRRFLTSVSQLCNSLNLWSSGAIVHMSADEKNREVHRLNRACTTLDRKLDKGIDGTISGIKDTMKESLFNRYGTLPKFARGSSQRGC